MPIVWRHRFRTAHVHPHSALQPSPGTLALLLSAGLSAAPSKITIDFDVDRNTRGFTAYSTSTATFSVAATGGLLTGTSPGGDPRLVFNSSTPIFSKPTAATWSDVKFRVRETAETSAVVTPWSNTSINVVINGRSGTSGATTIASTLATAEDSGDGFFTVTVPIPAAFTANDIRYFRFDPIGGTDAAGNLFEVGYVEVNLTNTPPTLVSTNPADDATGVGPNVTLSATFDEAIFLNTSYYVLIDKLESNENDGNKGAIVYPNHNFTDPAIAAAGGFSLAVDLNANLSGGTGRYLSIAVGRSSADIDAQTAATAVANSTGWHSCWELSIRILSRQTGFPPPRRMEVIFPSRLNASAAAPAAMRR